MKSFREFINEETMPFAQTEKGFVGIESPAVRDNINSLIAGVTDCEFITPYIALERVAKVLANFHIFLPKQTFLDSDRGMVTIEINQFGEKVGMQDNGEVVTQASSPYYLYFEYEVDDNGTFEVFSEVVTEDELDEILSDMDEEDEELDEEKDSEEEKDDEEDDEDEKEEKLDEACWEGYKQVGTKMKGGREVPNCVPLEEAVKKLVKKALKEVEGMHLDKPQKGKMSSINKLNKEEKSGMPAWYEKEKSKNASLQAATKAKKKEQQKKTDYAIRNMKEEQLDDKHFASQSKKKQDAINNQLRQGKSYKDAVKATKQVKEEQLDEISKKLAKRAYVGRVLDADDKQFYGKSAEKSQAASKKAEKTLGQIKKKHGTRAAYQAKKTATKELGLNEIADTEKGKKDLGNYIKQASHDVAAKSAAVRGFARDAEAQRKDKKPMDARKSDERADKMFKKSWNRRQGMAKAVDKLTKEETVNEVSVGKLVSYKNKAGEGREAGIKLAQKKLTGKAKVNATAPKHAYMEQMSPGRAGEIAAGRKGSTPAEQGSIAVRKDDEARAKTPQKANFNVAKNLARKAMKAQVAKAKEKK